ncbi:MAG TPA: DUF4440 domain-containing protein [Thermoanaerobaculia bacterium]|jgi:uncharacterized protein (TIGR02246 family)
MRKLLILIALTLPVYAADLRSEVEQRNRDLTTALERGDLAGVARIYADDAKIIGSRKTWSGREAIDRYWLALKGAKSWTLEVLEVGGMRDDAYQLGRSTLVTMRDGTEHRSVVDFVVIWRRGADGKLRIYRDLYN